jgi:hypothetical protein
MRFLKYDGKAMLSSLVDLFTAISDFEQIPSAWQNGIIKLIHISGSLFEFKKTLHPHSVESFRQVKKGEIGILYLLFFCREQIPCRVKTWSSSLLF